MQLIARSAPDRVWIEVADEGPGIPPEEREHVFDAFYRGEAAASGDVRGTGLGLSIVQQTAKLLGMDVRVDEAPSGGALVSLGIPREQGVGSRVNG